MYQWSRASHSRKEECAREVDKEVGGGVEALESSKTENAEMLLTLNSVGIEIENSAEFSPFGGEKLGTWAK